MIFDIILLGVILYYADKYFTPARLYFLDRKKIFRYIGLSMITVILISAVN